MITVDQLRNCAWLSGIHIEKLLQKNNIEYTILSAEFVGISNGNQFVYNIAYPQQDNIVKTKAFVWQENNGEIVADL